MRNNTFTLAQDYFICTLTFSLELLIPGKFISREGNLFPGTRLGLDRVSILSAANR